MVSDIDPETRAALEENQRARVHAGKELVAAYYSGNADELAQARANLRRLADEVLDIEERAGLRGAEGAA